MIESNDRLGLNSGKILVLGLQPFDAGKTTLCKALIHGFKEAGVHVIPFKPHSGISYWSQFDTFQRNLNDATLVCHDITELEEAAESRLPLEVLNPVNRITMPTFDRGIPEETLAFQQFLAERFTDHDGTSPRSVYYLKRESKASRMRGIKEYYERLKGRGDKIRYIRSFRGLVKAYDENFDRATCSCYRHIKDKALLMESFNDAAYPFNEAKDCDLVLCVSSNTVLQFEASRYFRTIELHDVSKPKLQLTLSDVYSPCLIIDRFQIQPLNTEERDNPTKLKQNYSRIIRKLVQEL